MTFHVGQKVVCVDGRSRLRGYLMPRSGNTYTVREIVDPSLYADGAPGVLLEEIVNQIERHPSGDRERPFHPRRFRPLRTTSIDVFLKMLEPQPQEKVPA